MKQGLLFLLLTTALISLYPQEALKSSDEEYYDFLALQGLTERPALNYRTLSDSVWEVNKNASHPWENQNLGSFHPLFGEARMRVYGPELFVSANTAAPYGQNDGVLWQGKGINASLSGGARFEGYGIELTLLPHFSFSQNLDFDIMPSNYTNEYGYFWGYGVDSPQRFGDEAFFDWDFGDSEIRYTWKTLTAGFGTQSIWLGPAYLNPILHSSNAPAYPKFDIGIRKQSVTIPRVDWYIGDIEARLWVGRLSESDYFDTDTRNDHTMIHGLALSYTPSFLPDFTLSANRVCLVPWAWENIKYVIPSFSNTNEDQKSSFGFSWLFPQVGFEVYGEIGIDDHTYRVGGLNTIEHISKFFGLLRHISHTMTYTIGTKKTLKISPQKNIFGELIFEWNNMEMSQDFQFQWPYSFYFHHQIIHGYTNGGQWLGNAYSPGGNSQYLEFKLYYPRGTSSAFLHRYNPDDNYLYQQAVLSSAEDYEDIKYHKSFKSNFVVGGSTEYRITNNLNIGGTLAYNLIINPFYYHGRTNFNDEKFMHNFHVSLFASYKL